MEFLRSLIFNNGLLKLVALGFALLIWANVAIESETQLTLQPAIRYQSLDPAFEVIPQGAREVTVDVTGPAAQLQELEGATVYLDLDFADVEEPGAKTFSVTTDVLQLPEGVRLLRAVPSQLRYDLERQQRTEVDVFPQLGGEYAANYVVSAIDVRPRALVVVGPESRVAAIESVSTGTIDLSGLMGTRRFTTSALLDDPYLRFESDPSVEVTVTMDRP